MTQKKNFFNAWENSRETVKIMNKFVMCMDLVFIVNSASDVLEKKSNRKCHSWLHDGTDVWTKMKINMWENLPRTTLKQWIIKCVKIPWVADLIWYN